MEKFVYREYGRALRGVPIYGKISGRKYKRVELRRVNATAKSSRRLCMMVRWIQGFSSIGFLKRCYLPLRRMAVSSWTMPHSTAKRGFATRDVPSFFFRPIRPISILSSISGLGSSVISAKSYLLILFLMTLFWLVLMSVKYINRPRKNISLALISRTRNACPYTPYQYLLKIPLRGEVAGVSLSGRSFFTYIIIK